MQEVANSIDFGGTMALFEMVRDEIAEHLLAAVEETALRQYISVQAGKADIRGVDLKETKILSFGDGPPASIPQSLSHPTAKAMRF